MSISVLMSVYNETEYELRESIESILNQSFRDFEFIIVNDNPENSLISTILEKYKQLDPRIKIIKNKKNMGLAMSLNRAAENAKFSLLARMDADDISIKYRLQRLHEEIMNREVDFVFSGFDYLDSNSSIIKNKYTYYDPETIEFKLPLGNVIHHPTVIFTKDIFEKAGKYRNFKAAQDYDLWLRMLDNGCRFYMIDEILLNYRVRDSSVTVSKRKEQECSMNYIRNLYIQRLKRGFDNYSYDDYLKFLDNNVSDESIEKINYCSDLLVTSHKCMIQKKRIHALLLRVQVFAISKTFRRSFINKMKVRYWTYKKRRQLR